MHKNLAIVIAAAACIGLSATALAQKAEKGWNSDLPKALAMAKKTGKIVMVDFNATWCGPCQMYKHDVFPTPGFKTATKDVILVEIDTDKQPDLAKKYKIQGIPDIRFFSPSGKQVGALVGFGGAERLISEIQKAKKSAGK